MLKSCKYCGRIHEEKHVCEPKRKSEEARWMKRKETKALHFRRSQAWTHKSVEVRKRDQYMCVCCKAMMPGTITQYNTIDLSVHHITPIEESYEARLDNGNLITVCPVHHKMCEAGEITRDQQRAFVLWSSGGGREGEGDGCTVV